MQLQQSNTLYTILGVQFNAPTNEIRQAYRKLARVSPYKLIDWQATTWLALVHQLSMTTPSPMLPIRALRHKMRH